MASEFAELARRDAKMLKYMEHHLGMKFDFAVLTPFPDENLFDKENEEIIEKDLDWDVDLNTQVKFLFWIL